MVVLDIWVPGRAVSQPRVSDGKYGDHKIMAPATHAIRGWRKSVKAVAQAALAGRAPLTGPMKLEITFVFRRPLRLCKQPGELLGPDEAYEGTRQWHYVDPDWDNIGKAISDSLKMGPWVDDCQVAWSEVKKRYADSRDGAEGVSIRATKL